MGSLSTRFGLAIISACLLLPAAVRAESASRAVEVSATILPRLELSVTPETGSAIAFGALTQPAEGTTASRSVNVALNVFSNLDRPYEVTQTLRQPLTNTAGQTIAPEQFRMTTRHAAHGTLTPEGAVLPGVPATLYTSDAHGKSDALLTDYSLTVTPMTPAGTFHTEILYTVTSL